MSAKPTIKPFVYIAVGVLLLWLAMFALVHFSAVVGFISHFTEVAGGTGPLGDSFGLLNSLFTGLALAALVYAIWLSTVQNE